MERIVILVDVQNVYYTTRKAFSSNFEYNAFWWIVGSNRCVVKAVAYAIDRGDAKQRRFQNILKTIGFEVKLKPFIQRSDGTAKASKFWGYSTVSLYSQVRQVDATPACRENLATLPIPPSKNSSHAGRVCKVNTLRSRCGPMAMR